MTCATCNPPVQGSDRVSEFHVGVRFRDHARGRWVVELDGKDVTNRCYEALAGEPGWAILNTETVCSGRHVCTVLEVGHVHVRCTPRPRQPADQPISTDS